MSVGIRVTFESDGRCVTLERNGNGFLCDLVGDGQAFIPATDLNGALAFLDEVRQALTECERTYVALLGPEPVQASTVTPAVQPEPGAETSGNNPVGEQRGKRGLTEAQMEVIKAGRGRTARELAAELGLPQALVAYHLTKARKEAAGQAEPEPAGFRANGTGHDGAE